MHSSNNRSSFLPRSAPGWTLLVVLLTVTAFPWCLGGWAMWANLAVPGILLIASLILAIYHPNKKQLALTWLLGVLPISAYLLIQALNPSHEVVWETGLRIFHLQPVDYITWLPTSVKSTFWDTNAWRFMMHWIPGLLFLGTLIGYSFSRKNMRIALSFWVISGTLLACVGMLYTFQDWNYYFGTYELGRPHNKLFYAGFIYKNHAGAFLNLCLAGAFFLALDSKRIAEIKGKRSNPGLLWLIAATLILASQVFSKSRAGLALSGLITLVFIFQFIHIHWRSFSSKRLKQLTLLTALICLASGAAFILTTQEGKRAANAVSGEWKEDNSYITRMRTYSAAVEILQENPILGTGGGSFVYRFPEYQNKTADTNKWSLKQWQWRYAHCDYLQIPIELGIVGCILLLLTPGIAAFNILKAPRAYRHQIRLLIAGIGAVLLHATMDFPLQNPAIIVSLLTLTTWIIVYVAPHNKEPQLKL